MSTPSVPSPDPLADLLIRIENACGRAADVLHAASRAVIGEDLDPHEEDVQTVVHLALEAAADEMEQVGADALRARAGTA